MFDKDLKILDFYVINQSVLQTLFCIQKAYNFPSVPFSRLIPYPCHTKTADKKCLAKKYDP